MNELDIGESSISSEPHTGLVLHLDNSTIKASANWKFSLGEPSAKTQGIFSSLAKIPSLFREATSKIPSVLKGGAWSLLRAAFSFQGSLRASASGVTFHTGILVRAERGLPYIEVTKCFVQVENFDLKFKGDGRCLSFLTDCLDTLYNLN